MPDEIRAATGAGKKFYSQLAGILAPANEFTDAAAEEILKKCFAKAGWTLPHVVHMEKIVKVAATQKRVVLFKRGYNKLIKELLQQVKGRGWQPVLLVNREGVSYGGMVQTYPSMVAELFIRACRQKQLEGLKQVKINFVCSEVQIQLPKKQQLPAFAYETRIRELQAMFAVRQGYAPESSTWRVGNVNTKEDDDSRALQLCDVLSHASHHHFDWCNADTKALFKDALAEYRWTMAVMELLERVEQLIEERSLGVALITLAEVFVLESDRRMLLEESSGCLSRVLDELADMLAPVRDSQLFITLSWLEQIITLQRNLPLGQKVADFLRVEVEAKLRERLGVRGTEVDWFAYGLSRWKLTACNHSGTLAEARAEVSEIERLLPVMAGRWEHFTLLTEGLIARAVHLTDCFEFARASEEMRLVAERYEALANAFSHGYPELHPTGIHSDLRAKALGTWLQSEMLSGHPAGECLSRARCLSEAAAAEFKDEDDKQRQYQYRCQLETLAGEFALAREFLGRSLSADPSHAAIAAAIGELADEPVEQGFALMHWLRLGSATLLAGDPAAREARDFAEALEKSNLAECSWCTGQHAFYPAHNILWRLATIYAAQGEHDGALRCIDVLHRLEPLKEKKVVLGALLLAAQAETAALLWESRPEAALKLLTSEEREQPGVKRLASLLRSQTIDHFPELTRLMESFASGVEAALGEEGAAQRRKRLLALGQLVCY
ncbi:MAG: hypothetical protein ACJ74T_21985 [Pyrinomonadaceae bacterium]